MCIYNYERKMFLCAELNRHGLMVKSHSENHYPVIFSLSVSKYYSDFRAVNYEELAICSPARKAGTQEGIYVYEFLKEPLIRALGEDLYKELCIAAVELRRNKTLKKWPDV